MATILNILQGISALFGDVMRLIGIFKAKKETAAHEINVIETKKEEEEIQKAVIDSDIDKLNSDIGWNE